MRNLFQSDFWKRFGLIVCIWIGIAAAVISSIFLKAGWDRKLSEAEQTVVDLSNQDVIRDQHAVSDQQNKDEVLLEAISGVDMPRKRTDDGIITDVIKYALNWSSFDEYRSNRVDLLAKYSWLDEDSLFMKSFFKAFDEESADFSDGRNMTFVSLDSHVLSVNGNIYTYLTEIQVQSRSESGSGTYDAGCVATYQTDSQGNVYDLMAFTMPL